MSSSNHLDEEYQETKNPEVLIPWGQLIILFSARVAEPISATVIYPFIPQLIQELGLAHGKDVGYYAGVIQSLYYLTSSTFVLYWGRLSDRVGRKPIIMIGLFGLALSGILFGISHSFVALILSRAVEGALNGSAVTIRTAVGEMMEESQVERVYPYLTSTYFAGTIIGPMIGGYLFHPADRIPLLFGNSFWRSNPYLLPCAVAALYSTGCLFIVSIRLRETHPDVCARIKFESSKTIHERSPLLSSQEEGKPSDLPPRRPPVSFRQALTPRVRLAVLNFTLLCFLRNSFMAIFPTFLATTLQLPPSTIGSTLGLMGLLTAVAPPIFYVPLKNRLHTRGLLTLCACSLGALFATFALISWIHTESDGRMGLGMLALLALVLLLSALIYMCTTASFTYTRASASSSSTLGITNALSEFAAQIVRALAPVTVNSLYAFSSHRSGIIGSYLVYWLLVAIAVVAVFVIRRLPEEPWKRESNNESK